MKYLPSYSAKTHKEETAMKHSTVALSLILFLFTSMAWAEHPGVATNHRDAIQKAMMTHIEEITERNANGMYPVFDPGAKAVVQLKLKEFHDSVEIMGRATPYFVSCADFTAEDGTVYDLDFLVSRNYGVVATLVHAKSGKKISYEIP
jgi:hypothetical protein